MKLFEFREDENEDTENILKRAISIIVIAVLIGLIGTFLLQVGTNAGTGLVLLGAPEKQTGLTLSEKTETVMTLLNEDAELKERYDSFGEYGVQKLLSSLEETDFDSKEEVEAYVRNFAPKTKEEMQNIQEQWEQENKELGLVPISQNEGITINGRGYTDEELSKMAEEELMALSEQMTEEQKTLSETN